MKDTFARNLKYIRELKRLSQQQVADMSKVDRSTISRYEANETAPSIENALKIADALNVPFEDFVSFDMKSDSYAFDSLELLFSKNKDILTDDDKETIKFIIEKRKKEIDKQLNEN